jgi:hypothetical protein
VTSRPIFERQDSYDYIVTYEAITIDSRFFWRARTKNGGFYWKTFDIFTHGESDIDQAYAKGDYTYPFWSHPIPKFIANQGGTTPGDYSYVATLELGKYSFDPKGSVGRYTGKDGPQQSAKKSSGVCPTDFKDMRCSAPGISGVSMRLPTSFAIRDFKDMSQTGRLISCPASALPAPSWIID